MKKISFGSFPLTEIKSQDRKCLDRYLIKTFSDNISISDAIRNLSITKSLMYITPDVLMKRWLKDDPTLKDDNPSSPDRRSNSTYDQALRRAFFVLKEFYKKIKDAPFYKNYIYYPIYVEKIEKVNIKGEGTDHSFSETQMNYSFIILSNDLTKSLKIDEIRYDENASVNFLFLFIEFFSGKEFNKSIHDFNRKDYEFLIKLYQFIEKSGKDPIHMTLDLYKLLGLVKTAADGGQDKRTFGLNVSKTIDDIESSQLKKYRGMIKHQLVDLLSKNIGSTEASYETYRKAFIDMMDSIFKSEGLSGLYGGVDSSADLGERHAYVYNTNKYHEILNLAKELVEYNGLTCNNVITTDPMDFDFTVEQGELTIETQSHIIADKYQTFFKTYVESISNYLDGLVQSIIKTLDIQSNVEKGAEKAFKSSNAAIRKLKREKDALIKENAIHEAEYNYNMSMTAGAPVNSPAAWQQVYLDKAKDHEIKKNENSNRIHKIDIEIGQREMLSGQMVKTIQGIEKTVASQGKEMSAKIKDAIISSLANDLTFIYDDGKRFFTNESVTKGFLSLIEKNNGYNPLKNTEFQRIAADHVNASEFPKTINDQPNPEYMTAQVIYGLQNSFDQMASDTATTIGDLLLPIVQEFLMKSNEHVAKDFAANIKNPFFGKSKNENTIINEILQSLFGSLNNTSVVTEEMEKALRSTIFRGRFIEYILKNFKRMFKVKHVEKTLAFDQSVSQLHPLIRKLIAKGKHCQYFKSFILNFDTAEQLYNLKFLVDTKKFLYGLSNQPPRKLGNPMNRIQVVLFDYLGLKNNPVWLISKSNVYLSMPDDLSLTNTSILSNIPKSDLMEVCKIKASDYWNEKTMNKVSQFGSKKIKDINDNILRIRKEIEALTKTNGTSNGKGGKKINNSDAIKKKQKQIDTLEEKLEKIKLDDKQFKPNAFLFSEDPELAEKTPLLTPAEMDDINKKKDNLESNLLKMNPYDDEEIRKMEEISKGQTQRSHPFDFEEDIKSDINPKDITDDELSKLDELLLKREESIQRELAKKEQADRDGNSPWNRS